jgi:hypothetical protein
MSAHPPLEADVDVSPPSRGPAWQISSCASCATSSRSPRNFISPCAERLYVTQPALSRQIAQLEHEIGVRLFERNRRRVELTLAGSVLLDSLREAFVRLERSLANARWTGQHGSIALQVACEAPAPYITG